MEWVFQRQASRLRVRQHDTMQFSDGIFHVECLGRLPDNPMIILRVVSENEPVATGIGHVLNNVGPLFFVFKILLSDPMAVRCTLPYWRRRVYPRVKQHLARRSNYSDLYNLRFL